MTVRRGSDRPPLYQQVKLALTDTLRTAELGPGDRFVTEREVCDRFGVSTTTAVRALNELVTDGVLIRRQGSGTFVAERTPTEPGVVAGVEAALPADRRTVACILQGYGGSHVTAILRGTEAWLADLGYRVYLTHSENDPVREARALREAMDGRVSGIVIYPAEGSANAELFTEARRLGIPLVMVDRYRPDVPTDAVVADNLAVGYDVTKALIELGHERIATLWLETECTSVRDRLTGHLLALRDHQLPVRSELVVLKRFRVPAGPAGSGLLQELFESAEPPTVLLCGNGYALAQAVEDLAALGLAVPRDIDLAGLDDAGPFDVLPLTAVAASLPSWEMGREAARILHARMSGDEPYHPAEHVVLPISLTTRDAAPAHLRVVGSDT